MSACDIYRGHASGWFQHPPAGRPTDRPRCRCRHWLIELFERDFSQNPVRSLARRPFIAPDGLIANFSVVARNTLARVRCSPSSSSPVPFSRVYFAFRSEENAGSYETRTYSLAFVPFRQVCALCKTSPGLLVNVKSRQEVGKNSFCDCPFFAIAPAFNVQRAVSSAFSLAGARTRERARAARA